MKILNVTAFICSLLCIVVSSSQRDFTEMMAWCVVMLYNLKELISDPK